MRRTIPAWQVVLSDLALILFLTTLAALQGTSKEAPGSLAEAPRSHEVAVYREAAGGLALAQWLETQPADPRLQLTVLARFTPGEFEQVHERAQRLASEAAKAGKPPRLVLEPAEHSEVLVSLAYDVPEAMSQAQSTRLRPDSLAR